MILWGWKRFNIMLFKKTYKLATMLAVMGALTGHAASDIDLNSIGYFSFTPLPADYKRRRIHCYYPIVLNM